MHKCIAAAWAAAKDNLNCARDCALGVNQQGPLQLGYHLLHAHVVAFSGLAMDKHLLSKKESFQGLSAGAVSNSGTASRMKADLVKSTHQAAGWHARSCQVYHSLSKCAWQCLPSQGQTFDQP